MGMTCTILAFKCFLGKCTSDKVFVAHVYMYVYVGYVRQTRRDMHQLVICLAKFAQFEKFAQCTPTQCMLVLNQDLLLFRHFKKIVFSQERRDFPIN